MTRQLRNPRGHDAAKRVLQFDFTIELFERNYRELRVFLGHLASPRVAVETGAVENRWLRHEAMRECGFLLHNFVAAAQSLVEHSRVAYRHLYATEGLIPEYRNEVDRRFVTDPLSQFVIGLRQMAQHYRLPSISLVKTFRSEPDGGTLEVQLLLSVEDLRTFSGWNASAKKYLNDAGKEIDISKVALDYHDHVIAFYRWFRTEQQRVHGLAPAVFAHITKHGLRSQADRIMARVIENVTHLEQQPRENLTYENLFNALAPALTVLDARMLMLCRHDPRAWLAEALASIESRFVVSAELRARLESLVSPIAV